MTDLMHRLRAADPVRRRRSSRRPSTRLLARIEKSPAATEPRRRGRRRGGRVAGRRRGAAGAGAGDRRAARRGHGRRIAAAVDVAGRRRRGPRGARQLRRDHPRGLAPRLHRRPAFRSFGPAVLRDRGRAPARALVRSQRALDRARPAARAQPLHDRAGKAAARRTRSTITFADGVMQVEQSWIDKLQTNKLSEAKYESRARRAEPRPARRPTRSPACASCSPTVS